MVVSQSPNGHAKKLCELQVAADLYCKKIATIEAKSSDQHFSLEMTQKLLRGVGHKITALEGQRA